MNPLASGCDKPVAAYLSQVSAKLAPPLGWGFFRSAFAGPGEK